MEDAARRRTRKTRPAVAWRIAVVLMLICMAGCGVQQLPNQITDDEYALYSAWLTRYSRNHPEQLYISQRTAVFDELLSGNCSRALHDQGKVPWSLIKPLQALGDAQYMLREYQHRLDVPVAYTMAEQMPLSSHEGFTYVSFSRVVFDRAHSEALFFFAHSGCEKGSGTQMVCGGGGAVALHAIKRSGQWQIEPAQGCMSVE
ncbi:MAG TPA: hypothetical protein VKH81_14655 [Candidatus Angelobacter sp.]|nr:hypothetical protein [Candidatus Angelobacter sp.]